VLVSSFQDWGEVSVSDSQAFSDVSDSPVSLTVSSTSDFLRSTALFAGVNAMAVRELAQKIATVTLGDGEVLVRPGDANRKLFIVKSGCLQVMGAGSSLLFQVTPGETTCEMGLLADDPSSTTVEAVGETVVLVVKRDDFDHFCASRPHMAFHLIQSLGRRLQAHRLSLALHLGRLLDLLAPEVARDLESELETFTLYGGEVLFRQGERGDYLCLIVNGRVRVTRNHQGEERHLADLGAGEMVGETAVIGEDVRDATVVAVRDTQLARLTKTAFDRFVLKHPTWAVQVVSRKLAQRLSEAHNSREPRTPDVSTVAIVVTHPSAPSAEFSRQLHLAFSKFGRALHVTSTRVDEHLGRPGIAQTFERDGHNVHVVEWLAKQESEHRYVLYEADPFLSPWTERCIRQADHIILLADAAGDPMPGEIEVELLDRTAKHHPARLWLVLVHGSADPSGTARWLHVRHVDRHYHVRLHDAASIDRLARLLTGRATGLTLGGGFARGLAHIGVFRAFEELHVPIDVVGSASMGAMLGALWAMGWDHDRIQNQVCAACHNFFGDLTFPFVAFQRGGRFSQAIRTIFGDAQIEDLWVPYFCTSANLNRTELKIHSQGSLAKAVLAATRAPGIFPPIVYDGELHIDGGVINNVPVDLMKVFCNGGVTIGVDVAPPHQLNPVRDYGDTISGWRTFWDRCFAKNRTWTPSILLVLIRTLEYTGISNLNDRVKSADIFIYPDMLRFKRTDFHRASEIVKAGYDCARATLVQHQSILPGGVADSASEAVDRNRQTRSRLE
jgi:predicted acylesterase/phospholipase RssA/CRP-like cAMP-binding protein